MKKTVSVMLTLVLLLCAVPVLAESGLQAAADNVQHAATLDEQLALLSGISVEYAAELEAGGWDAPLTCAPAQPLPEDLLPTDDMEEAELSVTDFEGAKLIAIYSDQGDMKLLGDFQARIPEAMRAASVREADAVLYLTHSIATRTDYIGAAYNRVYQAYVYRRGGNRWVLAYSVRTTPPVSGRGALYGEALLLSDLWNGVRQWFYGTIEVPCPEGTATYRITGRSCCLTGLEGDFVRYEIPQEVEGHPVVGIEYCKNDTLEELALPEGIVWIRYVGGKNLRRMNFPSSLRRIETYVSYGLDEMILNDELEEMAEYAVLKGPGESFRLPAALKAMGKGTLEYGADCASLVIPEGVTELPRCFLCDKGRVLCAFIPEGVSSFGTDLFDYGNVLIYTPEGSPAARWADRMGYAWVPCAKAEDMPKPVYEREGDFEYAILNGEAVLAGYLGSEVCVRVPDTLGGCPVAVVREHAFYGSDALRAVLFPDTVRKMEMGAVWECKELEAVFIPASVTQIHTQAVFSCQNAAVFAPEGSAAWETLQGTSLSVWTPGAEDAWFPKNIPGE